MKQFRINEQEKSRILGLHIEATSRQYLKEDLNNGMTTIERYNYNRGIQCFLNKKNVKDDEGKPLPIHQYVKDRYWERKKQYGKGLLNPNEKK